MPLAKMLPTDEPSNGMNDNAVDSCAESPADIDWMFAEPPESPTGLVGTAVDSAVQDLLGDLARCGVLRRSEVALLAGSRGLTPAEHVEVLGRLDAAGVDLGDPALQGSTTARRVRLRGAEGAVSQYLVEVGRHPLIDGRREVELWSVILAGSAADAQLEAQRIEPVLLRGLRGQSDAGRAAHAELVRANLRLVISIARSTRYDIGGIDLADRIQDGNLGLMHAATKFDGSKGFKFSTYATWWIKQAIERGMADRGRTIRLPVHVGEKVSLVRRTVHRLVARLDRDPTVSEIADVTGLDPGQIQWIRDIARPCRSLDALLGDDGDLRLSDVLSSDEERDGRTDPANIVEHTRFRQDVVDMLERVLPERSARILQRRFGLGTGDPETLEDIAADYGVTRERIRQIQNKALATLREHPEVATLWAYLADDDRLADPAVSSPVPHPSGEQHA